ncbi:MAG: DNA replication/repair protein RecF [Lachnospiraceae bacterium]|nr:DNA replication/repair protein RecF [Lachnospiraceae bacterium]
MVIRSLELTDYRNYPSLQIEFDEGTNILYGENAQGKTNILEAIYLCATTKTHKGSKDSEVIRFGASEGHIRSYVYGDGVTTKIDMHLRSGKSKVIAIDEKRIKKASDLLGLCKVVFFSPEDLNIIKSGPNYRRKFVDMELSQLDSFYLYNLINYHKIVDQRNKLLKDLAFQPHLVETLSIWDDQLVGYGKKLIERRRQFATQMGEILGPIHEKLSGGKEHLSAVYEPDTTEEDFAEQLLHARERDKKNKTTSVGPHKDDFSFLIGDVDVRRFGSQGQQRTAALSLKLAEIELMKKLSDSDDPPILLLDDVLSELDGNRQRFLLESIGEIQTFITCTGLEDFVNDRFEMNRVFEVHAGSVTQKSNL